ncbi:MAG: hypothetical protein O7B99_13990, partial [Planctomycetota bacterium]|nr:hypothetical protein [Planctomycetota bacterium]
MRETLALLRGLQELDRDLFTIRRELARLPQERDRKRSQIDARIHGLKELEARLRELHVKVKDIEDLTTSQRQRMRKLEGEAASSRGDAALMVAFQHEIRSLKREISEAEEEGLGLVEQADTLADERDKLVEAIAEEEKQFAEYDANIESELATARAKEEELGAKRKQRMGEG